MAPGVSLGLAPATTGESLCPRPRRQHVAADGGFGRLGRSLDGVVRGGSGAACSPGAGSGPALRVGRRGRRSRPRRARQEGQARHRPAGGRGPGAGGRRPPEADLVPRHSDGWPLWWRPGTRVRHGHSGGGARRRAHRRCQPTGRAHLRQAQLRRSPARAVRGRRVRAQGGDAADGRNRRAHRQRPHSRARSDLRPRRRQGSRAPGQWPDRGRRLTRQQHDRRGQQLLGPADGALRGRRGRQRRVAGREHRPRQRPHHPRRRDQGRSGAQDRAPVHGGLLGRAGLRAGVRRPQEPLEPRQRELLRDRRARPFAFDPAWQHRQRPKEHRGDQRPEQRPDRGRSRGREPRGGDPGRHAPDEPALRRRRHPRQPLDQHGGLPRHPDERLQQAARAASGRTSAATTRPPTCPRARGCRGSSGRSRCASPART